MTDFNGDLSVTESLVLTNLPFGLLPELPIILQFFTLILHYLTFILILLCIFLLLLKLLYNYTIYCYIVIVKVIKKATVNTIYSKSRGGGFVKSMTGLQNICFCYAYVVNFPSHWFVEAGYINKFPKEKHVLYLHRWCVRAFGIRTLTLSKVEQNAHQHTFSWHLKGKMWNFTSNSSVRKLFFAVPICLSLVILFHQIPNSKFANVKRISTKEQFNETTIEMKLCT